VTYRKKDYLKPVYSTLSNLQRVNVSLFLSYICTHQTKYSVSHSFTWKLNFTPKLTISNKKNFSRCNAKQWQLFLTHSDLFQFRKRSRKKFLRFKGDKLFRRILSLTFISWVMFISLFCWMQIRLLIAKMKKV